MNINNFNIKKYIKKKGERTMVNRVNKKLVIILLFTMLFTMLVPKEVSAATYNTKSSLYNAGKNAVGKTVRIYRAGSSANDAFEQDHESSHIYCIQHHVATTQKYYDYNVQNYIKIEGNVATNSSGNSVVDNKNLVLAYLLDKENWKKGYGGSGDEEVRNLAIKHYMTAGGWMSSVGSKLGISSNNINYFNINTSSKSASKKQKVNSFLARAKSYGTTNVSKKIPATISLAPKTLKPTAMNKLGPIKFTFTGTLQSIKLFNGNSEVRDIKSYTVGGNTKTLAQINTGNNVTINRNTENKVTKIEASTKSGNYISAELWICVKSNAKQNLMITRTKEETNPKTASITVGEPITGSLTIKKIDQDTNKALAAKFKIQTSSGKWLRGTNGSYTYNNSFANATEYTSPITLKGLKLDTYKVYEVKAPNNYDITVQTGYDKKNGWVYFGTATLSKTTASVTKTYKNKKTNGGLTITKIDKDSNRALSAGFKIQTPSGKWLKGTNGSYTYNNDYKNAQEYTSPITLKDLKYGTYKIYEVRPPQNYDLAAQEGYDKKNNWVPFGSATINANYPSVEKKCTNVQKISIKGYVWIDTPLTKATGDYNSLYDSTRESRVAGVTVNLVNKSSKNVLATTKTDANGEYLFNKVLSVSQLVDYYIEFNYNGVKTKAKDIAGNDINEDISKYIPVAFKADKNGSKALMDEVPYEDEKLPGIATTYKGSSEEKKYGLSGDLYNALIEGSVLNNINLGLKKIPDPTYTLEENLDYVQIRIKGYDYTYNYGVEGNTNYVGAPIVNFQKEGTIRGYTINIYPSDIAYKSENSQEELKVFVGYKIKIENTTVLGTGDSAKGYEELYKEKSLHISKLTDKFDTNRYKLNDSNWTEKDGTATINEDYLKDIKEDGIASGKTATKKIQFSVNKNAILDILNHPEGIYENYPTTAYTTGYHKYSRKDYSWNNNISKEQTHRTKNEDHDYSAPYLIFKLGEERILKGKVFEDGIVSTNGEKLGNGQYNDKENTVEGVKVELLDSNGEVSNMYPRKDVNYENVNGRKEISIPAKVTTGKNGEFELAGLVPGKYFLRFTYGDGTQKIYDVSGKELKTLNANDYKSTIITNDTIRTALQGGKDEEWYKKIGNNISSVAVDDLDTRIGVNNGSMKEVMAKTALLSITVENTPTNVANIQVSDDGKQVELAKNVFDGLNFGIIEMPIQSAKLQKVITKIRLADAQGNLKFEGNPEKDNIKGVSDLDNTENGGSSYLRAELPNEMISGATLTLTYGIKVTNTSDVNYYNNEYYWFGDKKDGKKEVTLKMKDLIDYLDKTLEFNQTGSDTRFILGTAEGETDAELAQKVIIKLNNWNETLYTENNKERNDSSCKTSDEFVLVAQRENLSIQDEEMEYINKVRVIAENSGDLRDTATSDSDKEKQVMKYKAIELKSQADTLEQARAILIPPTGADKLTIIIYTIAGVIALGLLSAGVAVIKKYVVK